MPQKAPPKRSVPGALFCFLMSVVCYGWVVESIVRGRVAFDGKSGHAEFRGIGGVLRGLFILSLGCALACIGCANLRPHRGRALATRASVFGAAGLACLLLTLLLEGLQYWIGKRP